MGKPSRSPGDRNGKIGVVCGHHDIVPTNDRLAAIHLTNASSCAKCGKPDSIQHTITECMEGRLIWTWTREEKLGMILRMDPRHITHDWLIRPAFQFWPPQRQATLLWIITHLVYSRLQSSRRLSRTYFREFVRRARWKPCQRTSPRPYTGRYLDLLLRPTMTRESEKQLYGRPDNWN
jgi:hypothetical protein